MDTIWAPASGKGVAGVSVIRISGPAVRFVIETMCGSVPLPKQAAFKSIRRRDGEVIDRGLVLFFAGPASFTGEDVGEFQVHGSRAVLAALASELATFSGVRPAEAGEFARRAFFNGKMDLTEIEGLADLLAAETEAQRRQALAQTGGSLRILYEGWRGRLLRARALIEADLDFADEDDVPGSVVDQAMKEIEVLARDIDSHLKGCRRGERLRDGYQIVLLGAPNAGKSSLLNTLARRDVAIVTEEPGTTRDLLEVHLDLGGYPVTIVDTAGLREGGGSIEREGMRRAVDRGEAADLIFWLVAPDGDGEVLPDGVSSEASRVWRIDSKSDLGSGARSEVDDGRWSRRFSLSSRSGDGIEALLEHLRFRLESEMSGSGPAVPTRERHEFELVGCRGALREALNAGGYGLELSAEWLRRAGDHLGRLTGRIGVEEVLGEIFGSFCVGK